MKKNRLMPLAMGTFVLAFVGCTNDIDDTSYQQQIKTEAEKLVEQCNNFKEIQVNLKSNVSGMYCSVYTEYPYDENGSLKSAPILAGLTPISTTLSVGNGVDNLYIVTSKGILTREVKDLDENLSNTTRTIENSTISEELNNAIDKAFPEAQWNLKNTDLYFNTDLKLTKPTDISITYVSDGLSKCDGILYMYTYPASVETPTIDQCTFYGIDQETGNTVKLEGAPEFPERVSAVSQLLKRPLSVSNYIFSNVEELKAGHRKADLGSFEAGLKVGFCYIGIYDLRGNDKPMHYSFTTPCLNDETHSLNKAARNDPSFHYTNPVSQGCIKKIIVNGKTYYVLGMENSFPDGSSYDADYNDMLCVMEFSSDAAVEVSQSAPANVDLETYKYARGYYLFEDNYPYKGDYDFNDVVIQYEIKTYVNRPSFINNCNEVKVALLAHGCSYKNEFGFYVGDKDNTSNGTFYPVFPEIQGFVNVSDNVDPSKFIYNDTLHFAGKIKGTQGEGALIRPYLKNLNGIIFNNSYSREGQEYPYVLDVPLETNTFNYTLGFNYTVEKEAGKGFRWCKEGNRIDDAYLATPKTSRWYLKGYKDESLLIQREENAD